MHELAHGIAVTLLCAALPGQYFGERVRTVFEPELHGSIGATFDIDGDGDLDMIANEGETGHVYLNDGFGRFTWLNSFFAGWYPQGDLSPAIGDIDNDGDLDLCVSTRAYTNDGSGNFTLSFSFPATLAENISRLLDYDNDGDLDYLVYIFTLGTNGAQLYDNDGTGNFTNVTATAFGGQSTYAGAINVGDVDGDGDTDILLSTGGLADLTLRVWRNQNGIFTPDPILTPSPNLFSLGASVHLRDVNNDSHLDITAAAFFEPAWTALNDGTGTFTPVSTTGLVAPVGSPERTLADWSGNGLTDHITPLGVYVQTQPLQFELHPLDGATMFGLIWVEDLDGDQDLDIASAGSSVFFHTIDGAVLAYSEPERPGLTHAHFNKLLASRTTGSANPTTQVLWRRDGQPQFFIDSVAAGNDPDRRFRQVPLPTLEAFDGAIVHSALPQQSTAVVITTESQAHYFELNGDEFLPAAALPTIAGDSRVAAAQLDDVVGEELVFGSAAHDGPRVFVRLPSGFVEFSPNLPPPPAATSASFETIVLADIDGDGDRDIVHEHRVLLNHGGCVWTVGPTFDQLTPANTQEIAAIDFDADGDCDLVLSGINQQPVLLENTGAAFVDVSATAIPASYTTGSYRLSVGDVDHDGWHDILIANNAETALLRNVGGAFEHIPTVAGIGGMALIDTNYDGRPDIFNGLSGQANLHTHLHAPFLAAAGSDWQLDLETWRVGVTANIAFVGIGTQEQFVVHPGIGRLFLNPHFADVVTMPLVAGSAQRLFAVPSQPTLLGTNLTAQALVLDDDRPQLSNAVRDRIR